MSRSSTKPPTHTMPTRAPNRGRRPPHQTTRHKHTRIPNFTILLALFLALFAGLLTAQSHVAGQVFHREGPGYRPIPGARIEARLAGADEIIASAKTGSMGRYLLGDLPAGEIVITATHARYYRAQQTEGNSGTTLRCPPSGLCAQLDFEMQPAGSLDILVVDSLGHPVESTSVQLHRLDQPSRTWKPARRTATGVFHTAGMSPGRYQVEAEPVERGGIRYERAATEFDFLHGQEKETIRLVMPSVRLYRISGRILGVSEADLPGMLVILEPESESKPGEPPPRLGAPLQPGGHFAINGVPRGTFTLKLFGEQDAHLDLGSGASRLLTTIEIDADKKGLLLTAPPDFPSP